MQRRSATRCFALALSALCLSGVAAAQPAATQSLPGRSNTTPRTFDVQRISFERWCQDIQRYAVERCDVRRQEDVQAFENYRSVVERYEVEFLREQEERRQVQERVDRDPSTSVQTLMGAPAR